MIFFQTFRSISRKLYGKNLGALPFARPLHRLLLRTLKPKGLTEVTTRLGQTMVVDPKDSGGANELLLYGAYDPFITEKLSGWIKPRMTVADIGAHIGYFTLIFSKLVGPAGQVFAFEPERHNREILELNVSKNNLKNVTIAPIALSDKQGMVKLFLDDSNLGNMSLGQKNIESADQKGVAEVPAETLDGYFCGRTVDFVKIDVQGAEGLVFAGGQKTLRSVQMILLEFWPYGLQNLGTDPVKFLANLEGLGFQIFVIDQERRFIKKVAPEKIVGISVNRPNGRGWCNLLCAKVPSADAL